MTAPECKHPDWWFDRTLSFCSKHKQEEMQTSCVQCGISSCYAKEDKLGRDGR